MAGVGELVFDAQFLCDFLNQLILKFTIIIYYLDEKIPKVV